MQATMNKQQRRAQERQQRQQDAQKAAQAAKRNQFFCESGVMDGG